MSLDGEFMQVVLNELIHNNCDLVNLHRYLIEYKDAGMNKSSMIMCLEKLRNEVDNETEDVLLELMDFVEGYCNPTFFVFVS